MMTLTEVNNLKLNPKCQIIIIKFKIPFTVLYSFLIVEIKIKQISITCNISTKKLHIENSF